MANQIKSQYIVTVDNAKTVLYESFNGNFYIGNPLELITQEYAIELLEQNEIIG